MNPMATVVAAGALTGGSLWLVWTGWSPERAPLQTLLDGFGQTPVEVEPASGEVLDVRIGRVARKIGIIDRTVNNMRADLRVLHRSPEEQAAQLVTSTLLGWLFIPVVSSFSLLAGGRIPLAIPFWTSILGAVTGAVWAVKSVKPEAIERRRAFSQALAAFCDVCGMSLASGQGVGSSLEPRRRPGAIGLS